MFDLPDLLPARGYETASNTTFLPRFEDIARHRAPRFPSDCALMTLLLRRC